MGKLFLGCPNWVRLKQGLDSLTNKVTSECKPILYMFIRKSQKNTLEVSASSITLFQRVGSVNGSPEGCPQLKVLNPKPVFLQTVKAGEMFIYVRAIGISLCDYTC